MAEGNSKKNANLGTSTIILMCLGKDTLIKHRK